MSRSGIFKRLCMPYPPTKNALSIMPLTSRVFVNLSRNVRKEKEKEIETGPGTHYQRRKLTAWRHLEKNMKGVCGGGTPSLEWRLTWPVLRSD